MGQDREVPFTGNYNDHYDGRYHYHVTTDDNYNNRAIYYHEHPASFVYDDDGNKIHDHLDTPAHYNNSRIHNDNPPVQV